MRGIGQKKCEALKPYIGLAGVESFYKLKKTLLSNQLQDVDLAALEREEAEALIMQARLKAGWVNEADLAPPPAAEEAPAAEVEP